MNSGIRRNKHRIMIMTLIITMIFVAAGILFSDYAKANEIEEKLLQGDKYLQEEKYEEASKVFNNAISLDKKNKDIYIKIKDIYLESGRLDDALYIMRLAEKNNLEDTDIKDQAGEIRRKFGVAEIEESIIQDELYTLPKEIPVRINNKDTKVSVKWNTTEIETGKLGAFTYEGIAEQYERPVKLTLKVLPKIASIKDINASVIQGQEYKLPATVEVLMSDQTTNEVAIKWELDKIDTAEVGVQSFAGVVEKYTHPVKLMLTVNPKPVVKAKKTGIIEKVYESNGKRYLLIDEVQFLTGEAAVEAAKKDGAAEYEDGKYFVYNDYYIVNKNSEIKSYEINSGASIELLGFLVDPYATGINNKPVSYEKFKNFVNVDFGNAPGSRAKLCHIYLENEVIVKVEGQYTP